MKELRGKGLGILAGFANLVISPDKVGDTLSIQFSEPSGTRNVWRLVVRVTTPEGDYVLGSFTTKPPVGGTGVRAARVVALAYLPGCQGWRIEAYGPSRAVARLTVTTSRLSIGGVDPIVPVNGSRLEVEQWDMPASPIVMAVQGILTPGPGTLEGIYGFTDPATPAGFFGFVDKASAVVNGDAWRIAPVPIGGLGVTDRLSFNFHPDGVLFSNQARWVLSSTLGTVTLLGAGGAVVQGDRI